MGETLGGVLRACGGEGREVAVEDAPRTRVGVQARVVEVAVGVGEPAQDLLEGGVGKALLGQVRRPVGGVEDGAGRHPPQDPRGQQDEG